MENYNILKKSGNKSIAMRILALDTSTIACSIALLEGDKVKVKHELSPIKHAKLLLGFLDEMIGSDLASLDVLAWGCGPGSFTGLRIAASVIQALGFSYKIPVVNVSSLAAIAQTAYQEQGWKKLLVAVDARMNEVYWGAYQINDQGFAELSAGEGLCPPIELPVQPEEEWYGVGSAWSIYQTELQQNLGKQIKLMDADCAPKALAVAQLGRLKYIQGQGKSSFDALPTYLRDNVCKNVELG